MTLETRNFETLALHGGSYRSDPATGAVAVPIYQTTSFQFENADHASRLFALEQLGPIYTRIGNPTQQAFEDRLLRSRAGRPPSQLPLDRRLPPSRSSTLPRPATISCPRPISTAAPGRCYRRP